MLPAVGVAILAQALVLHRQRARILIDERAAGRVRRVGLGQHHGSHAVLGPGGRRERVGSAATPAPPARVSRAVARSTADPIRPVAASYKIRGRGFIGAQLCGLGDCGLFPPLPRRAELSLARATAAAAASPRSG